MNESSWNLVIPVLVIGLTVGLVWVALWRRRRTRAAESTERDRKLLLADLEARQALLYEQIREAEGAERETLELAAARNLMAIERAGGAQGSATKAAGRGGGSGVAAKAEERATVAEGSVPLASTPSRQPSAMLGFIGGVACAALIGLLVVWAQRDAKPRPDDTMGGPMSVEEAHPEGPPLSERERQALEQLASMIENDPTDLMARKQYAVGLLSTGRFMAAFEQAEILLGTDPNDPDGLYVKGMVRMRMGQEREAQALLERLLVDYPDHVPALTALGVLALRGGGLERADDYWDQAVEFSGGSNPEVERLRAAAREQLAATGDSGAGQMPGVANPPPPTPAAPIAGPVYTLELALAPGAAASPAGVLFVALRSGAGGPPSAVKRLDNPRFPMTVTLSGSDTMMGQPLPEQGVVSVRLDADGSASTRDDSEPSGEASMRAGETVRLTLQ